MYVYHKCSRVHSVYNNCSWQELNNDWNCKNEYTYVAANLPQFLFTYTNQLYAGPLTGGNWGIFPGPHLVGDLKGQATGSIAILSTLEHTYNKKRATV